MTLLYYIYVYLIVLNVYTFLLMGHDKRSAKRNRRRVPERRFFVLGAIGGAIGVWYGMKKWRHKTQHRSFTTGVPFLVVLNVLVIFVATSLWGTNASN